MMSLSVNLISLQAFLLGDLLCNVSVYQQVNDLDRLQDFGTLSFCNSLVTWPSLYFLVLYTNQENKFDISIKEGSHVLLLSYVWVSVYFFSRLPGSAIANKIPLSARDQNRVHAHVLLKLWLSHFQKVPFKFPVSQLL